MSAPKPEDVEWLTPHFGIAEYIPTDATPEFKGVKEMFKTTIVERDQQIPNGEWQAVFTTSADYGCNFVYLRKPGDTNSIRIVYPRNGEPLIDTEKDDTPLNIAPTGDLKLDSRTGRVLIKGETVEALINRVVAEQLNVLFPPEFLNQLHALVDPTLFRSPPV